MPRSFAVRKMSIYMDETTPPIDFEFRYYQGPRTYISNVLLWKKMPDTLPAGKANWAQVSNEFFQSLNTNTPNLTNNGWVTAYFFNETNPTDKWDLLVSNFGMQIIPAAVYNIPPDLIPPSCN